MDACIDPGLRRVTFQPRQICRRTPFMGTKAHPDAMRV